MRESSILYIIAERVAIRETTCNHRLVSTEKMATSGIKIPSSDETTPEYNAVRNSRGEIEPAIIPDTFVSRAHSCGLLPTSNPSRPPLDVVLNEISRDPVNYYSLQHVIGLFQVIKIHPHERTLSPFPP